MQRRRTLRGEELQDFLKSIYRLGYPARPKPWRYEVRPYLGRQAEGVTKTRTSPKSPSMTVTSPKKAPSSTALRSQFQYETSQISQGWESSDAIA